MYCGTNDGISWNFSNTPDFLENIELTQLEYEELKKGESDGKKIKYTHEKKPFLYDEDEDMEMQIAIYTQYLYSTDYIITKISEGESSMEEYKSVFEARQKAREKINELYRLKN